VSRAAVTIAAVCAVLPGSSLSMPWADARFHDPEDFSARADREVFAIMEIAALGVRHSAGGSIKPHPQVRHAAKSRYFGMLAGLPKYSLKDESST
jgi:hypothetical protein